MDEREYWLQEFEYQKSEILLRLEAASGLANATLKGLLLANGGAIISLLTYVGNEGSVADARALKSAFIAFAAGLSCCMLAHLVGYASQAKLIGESAKRLRNAQQRMMGLPVEDAVEDKPAFLGGLNISWSAFLLAYLSLGIFVAGGWFALTGIL